MPGDLQTIGLSVSYRRAKAVQSVDLHAPAGKVTAVVGANGAGKSSLLLALYGSVAATGAVLLDGEDISGLRTPQRVRRGLAIVPQGRQFFPRLAVRENLQVMADMVHVDRSAVDQAMDRYPVLRTRERSLAGVLSGGEQQMLVVSRSLMTSPSVLLLDEMATGLSPLLAEQLVESVVELSRAGLAIVIAAPSIGAFADHVDRGYVLRRGEIVATVEDGGRALESEYRRSLGMDA